MWKRAEYLRLLGEITYFSERRQTPVSMKQITQHAASASLALIPSALFLHKELPIRLAHRVQDLDSLPRGLAVLPSIKKVREWYLQSFNELRAFEFSTPISGADELRFHAMLENIFTRHTFTAERMAQGCIELRTQMEEYYPGEQFWRQPEMERIQTIFDSFFLSRVGIRFLIGQQLAMHKQFVDNQSTPNPEVFGLVNFKTSPLGVVRAAIKKSEQICKELHGFAPRVDVFCVEPDLTFTHVPHQIEHIVLELLKNAMRTMVEVHGPKVADPGTAPIRVVIADGAMNEDVVIRVSDNGNGIPRSQLTKVWSYFSQREDSLLPSGEPKWGTHFGLPIGRLTARYFGGDLTVVSLERCSTDAVVHLRRFKEGDKDESFRERLPDERAETMPWRRSASH